MNENKIETIADGDRLESILDALLVDSWDNLFRSAQ